MNPLLRRLLSAAIVVGAAIVPTCVSAEIVARLESPVGYASQVANVQGWAFTTTEGAELIQPFEVSIDGVKALEVPCCSDRGDVRQVHPEAPLRTGFSGVINWSREALAADGPVLVSVVIRDTAGGEVVLEETVDLYASSAFPFAQNVHFGYHLDGVPVAAAGDPDAPIVDGEEHLSSRCRLSNVTPPGGFPVAELACMGLTAETGSGSRHVCRGETRFTWDRGVQGFRQSSGCRQRVRWTNHGDGTATDNETGLMWELKTGDPSGPGEPCEQADDAVSCADPHDVNNQYEWSTDADGNRTGSVFQLFLNQLNSATSFAGHSSQGCFAGYCDWRLPTVEELRTLVEPCESSPCGSIPGETAEHWYWSSSADAQESNMAWDIDFRDGSVDLAKKGFDDAARAVRGTFRRQVDDVIH